jgi:hypothetical protein
MNHRQPQQRKKKGAMKSNLRAKMTAELKAVLAPEQQQNRKDRRARRLERMKSGLEARTEKPAE